MNRITNQFSQLKTLINSKALLGKLGYLCYVCIFTLVMLEILLRILQYEPYHYYPFSIQSSPKQCILPDSTYGFRLNPGQYQVTINDGLVFQAQHDSGYQRITPITDSATFQVQLHGCSYTYGFGIDDSLTVAYQLQQQLPWAKVDNKAVLGYGTIQAYHLIQESIRTQQQPDMVILNYASFHDDRNVLTPNYRKDLKNGFANADSSMKSGYESLHFPYVIMENEALQFRFDRWDAIYTNWYGREHSVLVNLLQTISDKWSSSLFQKEELTNLLIQEISQLCQQHGIDVVVAGITQDQRTAAVLNFCKAQGIKTVDISVDLMNVAYNNLPFDTHPNGEAHTLFAKKLSHYLQENHRP